MVFAQPPSPCAVTVTETLASDQPNDEPDIKWLRETVLVEAARWWGAKAQDLISRCTDRLLSAGPQAVSQALLRRAAVDITIDAWCSARALLRGRLRAPQTNYVSLKDWQSEVGLCDTPFSCAISDRIHKYTSQASSCNRLLVNPSGRRHSVHRTST